MKSPRIGRIACIAAILAQGCASPASSIEREAPPLEAALVSPALEATMDAVAGVIEQRGFSATGDPSRAFLVEHDALVQPSSLPNGRCQVFVVLGSPALREISLGVFDSSGTELASTRASAPSVALRFCPDLPGMHFVSVRALAGDGLVAARRFEGPSGIAIDLDDLFARSEEAAVTP